MRRFIEIMWLAIAAISVIEMIVGYINEGIASHDFQIFGIVLVVAAFMYFLRKRQRKNIESHKNGK